MIQRKDGATQEVPVTLRIDTPIEVDYYQHGGILPLRAARAARGGLRHALHRALPCRRRCDHAHGNRPAPKPAPPPPPAKPRIGIVGHVAEVKERGLTGENWKGVIESLFTYDTEGNVIGVRYEVTVLYDDSTSSVVVVPEVPGVETGSVCG